MGEGYVQAGPEVQVRDGKTNVDIKAYSRFNAGMKDVRSLKWNNVMLFHNLSAIDVQGSHAITPDIEAFAQVVLGTRSFGPQAIFGAGVRDPAGVNSVEAGYYGRLSENVPEWVPGAAPTVYLKAMTEALKGWKIGLTYDQPLQNRRPMLKIDANVLLGQ